MVSNARRALLCSPALLKKGFALLLSVAVFVGLARLAGAKGFKTAFLARYGLWFVVDWYDCFFLDWVLFANIKRIRFPGTEQMDQAYHQKKYHVIRSLIGMALGLFPCFICGWIVAVIS